VPGATHELGSSKMTKAIINAQLHIVPIPI